MDQGSLRWKSREELGAWATLLAICYGLTMLSHILENITNTPQSSKVVQDFACRYKMEIQRSLLLRQYSGLNSIL